MKKYLLIFSLVFVCVFAVYAQSANEKECIKPEMTDSLIRAANTIQSKYLQLQNGGGAMKQLGDPNGNGVFTNFQYNFSNSNKCVIFTGEAVPNLGGEFLQPKMNITDESANPSTNAFTVSNVNNPTLGILGAGSNPTPPLTAIPFPFPADAITYYDKINGSDGSPHPDGVNDGFKGSTKAVDGFFIEYSAQIGLNAYTEKPDMIEFFVTAKNISDKALVFGMSWNVDTYIGTTNGDNAPFYVMGCRQFTTSQVSVGFPILDKSTAENFYKSLDPPFFQIGFNPFTTSVPEYFYALNPNTDVSALIMTNLGVRDGIEWKKADYAGISHYSQICAAGITGEAYYFFGANNGHSAGTNDSGHMLRWDPQIVLPGETIYLGYAYGAGNAKNFEDGVINFMDDMAPSIILTDAQQCSYTNAPFTSSTKVANLSLGNILPGGTITLKIPRAYLYVENEMLASNWVFDAVNSGSDPDYDYYIYTLGSINAQITHVVNPPVFLGVIPQYVADVNTKYWLIIDVKTNIPVEVVPEIIEKNLFIPKLNYLTIEATAGANGTINPMGTILVGCGIDTTFTFTPDANYSILDVLVDGVSNPQAVLDGYYTFQDVSDDHTIHVTFKPDEVNITVNVSPTVSPVCGSATVTGGTGPNNNTFQIGDSATVKASQTNPCYYFVEWRDNTGVVSTDSIYKFEVLEAKTLTAHFAIYQYAITIDVTPPDAGTVTPITTYDCGTTATILAKPVPCFSFVEWTDENGVVISTSATTTYTVKKPMTLTAHFAPGEYTVNVSASPFGGGTVTSNGTTFLCHESCTVTATANPPLYKFSHWEDYGIRLEDADATYTFPVTGDHDLVAVFVKERVVIHVEAYPDGTGMVYQSAYMPELDSLMHVWAEPAFCHTFTKWTTLDGYTLQPTDPDFWFTVYPTLYSNIIDGVLTLVAHFKPNTFEITLEPSPTQGGDVFGNGVYGGGSFVCEQELVIEAVPSLHYKFVRWVRVVGTDSLHLSNSPVCTLTVKSSMDLVAIFELETFLIKVLPNPTGAGEAGTGGYFSYGDTIPLYALAYDEWTFNHWSEEGVPNLGVLPDLFYTVLDTATIYANFIPKTFEVRVVDSPPGSGVVRENGINIPYGTLWGISAEANPTWEFSHWENNVTGESYNWGPFRTIAVNHDFDLTAFFVRKQYEITLESDPPLGGTLTGGGTFVHGTVITVEATDLECHTFSHWTENDSPVSSTPTYTFTVTGPRHLVAHFDPEIYDITLTANPAGVGILTGGGPKACKTEITVTAIPDTCHVFEGWYENGKPVWNFPDYTFIVEEPRELIAQFTQKTFTLNTSVSPPVAPPGSGHIDVTGGGVKDIPCEEERVVEAVAHVGYVFTHWTINGVDAGNTNPYTLLMLEDKNVVAHFLFTEHQITLYAQPNIGGKADTSGTYPHGLLLTVHATPNPEYVFREWREDGIVVPGAEADFPFLVDRSRTLTAHFDTATYSVTTAPDPLNGGNTSGGGTDILHGTLITVTAEPNPCFVFDYWSLPNGEWKSGDPAYTFPVTQSCHLVAHFKKQLFNIILKANPSFPPGGMPVVVGGSGYNIPCGDSITIQSNPLSNYKFVNWTINGVPVATTDPYSFTVTQSDTITANYTLKTYDVLLSVATPPGGGMVWGSPLNNIPHGSTIEIHAQPNECYKFLYWKEFGGTAVFSTNAHILNLPVTKPMHLVAYFEPEVYKITLKKAPPYGGYLTPPDSVLFLPCLTPFTVTATENPHFFWDKWTDEDDPTWVEWQRTVAFDVIGSRTLIAHFTAESYEIQVSTDPPSGGGTVAGGGTFDYGMTIPISATADTCYHFDGWYDDEGFVSSDNPYYHTVVGTHHFVAHFTQKILSFTTGVSPNGSGSVTVTGSQTDIPCGEERTVEALANIGFVFQYWTFNGVQAGNTNPLTFNVLDNYNIIAHFDSVTHNITLAKTPTIGGNVWGGGTFPHNTIITVHAKANMGYKFTHWSENDTVVQNADTAYTFAVVNDRLLTAHFSSSAFIISTQPKVVGTGTTTPAYEGGITYGATRTVVATPAENYKFVYWMENDVPIPAAQSTFSFAVNRDRHLVALFSPVNCNVTVSAKPPPGGTADGGGYNIPYGDTTKVWATANENYDFANWTDEKDSLFSPDNPHEFLVTRTIHLTANFTPKLYDVNVWASPNGGGLATGGGTNIPYLTDTIVHAKPYEGYVFVGWYEADKYLNEISDWRFTVTRNRDLEARFEPEKLSVTLLANPEDGGEVWGGGTDFSYGELITVHTKPYPYHTFNNWTDETGTIRSWDLDYPFSVIQSCTLTANFTAQTSKITLLANPPQAGTLTGGGDIVPKRPCTISATPDPCYTFINWTENGTEFTKNPQHTFTVGEEDRTFTANFIIKTMNITTAAAPVEGGWVEGGANNIPCGEMVTVTAEPFENYVFVNWTMNGEEVSALTSYTFKAEQSCDLVANFALQSFEITVTPNPKNLGTATGNGTFPYGTLHTVSATPFVGQSFVNWTENGVEVSKTENYTFTVTGARDMVANFEKTMYTIIVIPNDTLYGTAFGSGKYEQDELVSAVAAPKKGYQFSGWTINDTAVHFNNVYEFPATKSLTLVANFYGLDFDTYAATLWDNTFMLDLRKLESEGHEITNCKWFKNNKQEAHTNTLNEFSYSAGPKITDKLELDPTFYYFQLTTKKGLELYSTKKVLPYYYYYPAPANKNLFVYPNPAETGMVLTIENAIKGALLQVYNQYGVCIETITASSETITLSLNLPAGIYLIKNENKEAKVVITR